jgi:multiple sugar transport system permease protein
VSTTSRALSAARADARSLRWAMLETVLVHAFLIAVSVLMLVPFAWMVATSLKPPDEVLSLTPNWLPRRLVPGNFAEVWLKLPFGRFYLNSLFVAATATVSTVFLGSLTGYVLAKFDFPGRDVLFVLILATMMVPVEVTFIPLYILMADLGWVNSYQGLIAPTLMTGFGVFLMRQFTRTIPNDFVEAARIDGASELGIYARVILPLTTPALATLAIFTFMANWDAFLWPLIITNSTLMKTIPLGIASYLQQEAGYPARFNLIMAANLIGVVPVMIVFGSMQRYFVKGIVAGGIKG